MSAQGNRSDHHIAATGRYCEECGCDVQEIVQVFPGHLRKECAECGSTGPFVAENPHYGPGNPDFARDRFRERFLRP